MPYIDMAYQGLGNGVAEDAFGARLFAAELPELIVAVSCSKNFGLYRERTGALHVVNQTPAGGGRGAEPARAHRAHHLLDAAGSRRGHRARDSHERWPARLVAR